MHTHSVHTCPAYIHTYNTHSAQTHTAHTHTHTHTYTRTHTHAQHNIIQNGVYISLITCAHWSPQVGSIFSFGDQPLSSSPTALDTPTHTNTHTHDTYRTLPIIGQYQLSATSAMYVNDGVSGIDLSSARGCTIVCGIVEKVRG